MSKRKRKKKKDFSKKVVIVTFITCMWFTVKMINTFETYGMVPDELIRSFFGTFILELFVLSRITINKNKIPKYEDENNDIDAG